MLDSAEAAHEPCRALDLEGGGALGAYHAGLHEALAASGVRPPSTLRRPDRGIRTFVGELSAAWAASFGVPGMFRLRRLPFSAPA